MKGEDFMLQRPSEIEFPPYYKEYVKLVPDGELVQVLKDDLAKTISLFGGLTEEKSQYRYAPNKWDVKEVLGHMTDTERIMSYRLLRVGRGDQTALAGFDENLYVKGALHDRLPIQAILEDFIATRNATITLIQNMPEEAWNQKGFANNTEITTRAIAYIIAGHAIHHKKVVTERYGVN